MGPIPPHRSDIIVLPIDIGVIELHVREKLLIVVSPHSNTPRRPIRGGLQALKNSHQTELNLKSRPPR